MLLLAGVVASLSIMTNNATLFGKNGINANGDAVYTVQKFLKMRLTVDGDAEFFVKWVGFKTPTWEPRGNVDTTAPMYQEFLRKEIASGKTPRVYTPRSSKGSIKNSPVKVSTSKHHVQLKARREMEEALSEDQHEQDEEDEEEDVEGEQEEEEEDEEDARRGRKRQRSEEGDDEEEEDEVEKKMARVDQENNNGASMCWFL